MVTESVQKLAQQIQSEGEVPIDLPMNYRVVFDSINGNYPVNSRIQGDICGVPVDLELSYQKVPNTQGHYPVNNRLKGTIGGEPVVGLFRSQIHFSSIAGNIPINTGLTVWFGDQEYKLGMLGGRGVGAARGRKGSGKKKNTSKLPKTKMRAGQEIVIDDDEGGIAGEALIPLNAGVEGTVGPFELELSFEATYFCSASSGRSPVNHRAQGVIRYVGG